MGWGMKGNVTIHMYFIWRYFAETECRSNSVPKLPFNGKKGKQPSSKTNFEYKLFFFLITPVLVS